jgi:ArsR family transcriptional regulator
VENPSTKELRLLHSKICKSLGDPLRIQILYTLNEEPRNVSYLSERLKIPQPTISRHLAILRQSSMVVAERDGQTVIYHLTDRRIIAVLDTMRKILRDSLERQTNLLVGSEDSIPLK